MRRLILHIGLPKTGSTSLQKFVFPVLRNVCYLGKFHGTYINHEEMLSNIQKAQDTYLYSNEDVTNPFCEFPMVVLNDTIETIQPDKVIIIWSVRDPVNWARSWYNAGFENPDVSYKDFLRNTLRGENFFSIKILNFDVMTICEQISRYDEILLLNVEGKYYTKESIENIARLFELELAEVERLLSTRTNGKKGATYLFMKKFIYGNNLLLNFYNRSPENVRALCKKIVRQLALFTAYFEAMHDKETSLLEETLRREFKK